MSAIIIAIAVFTAAPGSQSAAAVVKITNDRGGNIGAYYDRIPRCATAVTGS